MVNSGVLQWSIIILPKHRCTRYDWHQPLSLIITVSCRFFGMNHFNDMAKLKMLAQCTLIIYCICHSKGQRMNMKANRKYNYKTFSTLVLGLDSGEPGIIKKIYSTSITFGPLLLLREISCMMEQDQTLVLERVIFLPFKLGEAKSTKFWMKLSMLLIKYSLVVCPSWLTHRW